MKNKYVILFLIGLIHSVTLIGQMITLNTNQASLLVANAGVDKTLAVGHSVVLGGIPAAANGYGSYLYLWSPATGLDDPTKANPTANPSLTTTYVLTVTDAKNCSVQDDVIVTVQTTGISDEAESLDFKVYPNPSYGNLSLEINGVSGQINLRIVNSIGLVVHEINQESGTYFHEELDTRNFPKGCYFVIAISKGQVIKKPVIIL